LYAVVHGAESERSVLLGYNCTVTPCHSKNWRKKKWAEKIGDGASEV